jgi:predicted MFS family arabinose efflux permease
MGIFMATYPASMIAVYSLHPVLLDHFGWRNELLLLAALVLAAIPLFLVAVGRTGAVDHDTDSAPQRIPLEVPPALVVLAVVWLLFFAVHASVLTFAPSWAGGGPGALLIVTLVMWVAMLGSPLVGTMIDRTARPTRWLTAGLLIQAACLGAMATDRLGPTSAMLGIGLAAAVVPTAVYALPDRLVGAERIGFAFGFITSFSNIGTLAGPAVSGRLLDVAARWSPVWATLGTAALIAAAAAITIRPSR